MCVAVVTVAAPRALPVRGSCPPDRVAAPQAQRLPDRGLGRAGGKNHKKTDAPAASSPYGQYHLVNLADNHF